jgi:hypothetical protein
MAFASPSGEIKDLLATVTYPVVFSGRDGQASIAVAVDVKASPLFAKGQQRQCDVDQEDDASGHDVRILEHLSTL